MNTLKEISKTWSVEAKKEDSSRYFFHTDEAEEIENGEKHFVIGRKGSGKTAIARYLEVKKDSKWFATKLSFKSFPFNDIYELEDKGYPKPNQYITLWKYLIYSHIAKLMLKNENIDSDIREKLQQVYGNDPSRLQNKIKRWVGSGFKFFGIGSDFKYTLVDNETSWYDKVDILENIIETYIDDSKYFIIFDELDEDYKDVIQQDLSDNYKALITSLFKAVEDIKSHFLEFKGLLPIVFLRDDIYEVLVTNDKNKWREDIIFIDWDLARIKKLLAFRISRTLDQTIKSPLSFKDAWRQIFTDALITYGNRNSKKTEILNFMAMSTHMRPRDFIEYIRACAESLKDSDDDNLKIKAKIVKDNEERFSNYFRDELEDEIFAIFPNIKKIFSIFAQFHRQTFHLKDLKKFYIQNSTHKELSEEEQNLEFVLKILFHFSIIGNHPDPNNRRFKYENKEETIEFGKSLCFHRGLFKSLKIN